LKFLLNPEYLSVFNQLPLRAAQLQAAKSAWLLVDSYLDSDFCHRASYV